MATFDTARSGSQTAEPGYAAKKPFASGQITHPVVPAAQDADTVSDDEFHVVAAYFGILRGFINSSRAAAKRFCITPQQYDAMLEICSCSDPSDITVGRLAKRLNIKHNTAVMIINKLCQKGYVIRVRSKRDHRLMHLQLTDDGSAFLTRLMHEMHRDFIGMASGFAHIARSPL